MSVELNRSRQNVSTILGASSMITYLKLMGCWFRGKMSKEEFDERARSLFTDDTVRAHNEFLLAMLQKCQSASATLSSRDMNNTTQAEQISAPPTLSRQKSNKKKPYVKANFAQRFQPANQLMQIQKMHQPPSLENKLMFVSRDHSLLPNPAMIQGRLHVAAWEAGLKTVQNDVCAQISLATELLMKNIISGILSKYRGQQTRSSTRFKHSMGIPVIPSALKRSSDQSENLITKIIKEEKDAIQSLVRAGHMVPPNEPITTRDMFLALKVDRDSIAVHSIYNLTMERLSSRMYHLDKEEIRS